MAFKSLKELMLLGLEFEILKDVNFKMLQYSNLLG